MTPLLDRYMMMVGTHLDGIKGMADHRGGHSSTSSGQETLEHRGVTQSGGCNPLYLGLHAVSYIS